MGEEEWQRNIFHMEFPDTYEEKNPTMYENTAFEIYEYVKGYLWWFYELYLE